MPLHSVSRSQFQAAVEQGLLRPEQVQPLWEFLQAQGADTPSFRFTHVLYYLGGMMAIGAMTLFMTLGWQRLGGWGVFGLALAYGALGVWLTRYLLERQRLPVPAGICGALVVSLAPLAIYGLQLALGLWSPEAGASAYRDYHVRVDWRWLLMELGTLACGAVMVWRFRLPFLLMPVAVTLWYLSMDLTPFLAGQGDGDWALRKQVSLGFGGLMVLLAFWVDVRSRRSGRDFAFWLYLWGALTFWGGLSWMQSHSEWGKFGYLCVNVAMIGVGALLQRRVFAVLGGLGMAGYLGHLAHSVFKDSVAFPFALTAIGLAVVGLGVVWQRHEPALAGRLRAVLPAPWRELLEQG